MSAGTELGVEILWDGPARETDVASQIEIVDSMVARRLDGIALAACERQALVPAVERAVAAGIPVAIFDSGLDSPAYSTFIATDNLEAGRAAARAIGAKLGGNGEIGVVMHAPGSASTMDRERGFRETIEREFPRMKIVAEDYGMSDSSKSRLAADGILTAHAGIVALFASSEPGSVGAALAIKARGLEQKVFVLAFDSSDSIIGDLRGGAIDAAIVQDPRRMGYEAVRVLVQKLEGKNPPKRVDLNSILVRKEDLNEPKVKRLLNLP